MSPIPPSGFRGPSWTLRLAALALASAPFLHPGSAGSGGSFRPFDDLPVLGRMFDDLPELPGGGAMSASYQSSFADAPSVIVRGS